MRRHVSTWTRHTHHITLTRKLIFALSVFWLLWQCSMLLFPCHPLLELSAAPADVVFCFMLPGLRSITKRTFLLSIIGIPRENKKLSSRRETARRYITEVDFSSLVKFKRSRWFYSFSLNILNSITNFYLFMSTSTYVGRRLRACHKCGGQTAPSVCW